MRKPIIKIGSRLGGETEEAALKRFRREIQGYPLHSRLSPERELCVQLKVSRGRLRAALATFEAEGLIWRHVGQGTFVGSGPPPATIRAPSMLERNTISPKELIDARLVLEPAVTAYAASAARSEDIRQLRHCAAKRESASDSESYNRWDRAFHKAIAEASQNPIFISLFEQINALRSAPTYRRDPMQEPFRSISAREHQDIISAIADGNPIAAFNSMRAHLASVQSIFYSWTEMDIRTPPVLSRR